MKTYGLNIGEFVADYGGRYVITAGERGTGYCAQRRNEHGHGCGQKYTALTLDELAALLEGEAGA